MEEWKERVLVEQKELKEKLAKLTEYINSERFYALSANNRQVLKNQKAAMELYLSVLNMRAFENIDDIYVPNLEMMYTLSSAFTGNLFGQKTDSIKSIESVIQDDVKKAEIAAEAAE